MGMMELGLAVVVGAVSVELFTRSWKHLLRILACQVLLRRGDLGLKSCRARMHREVLLSILCSLSLVLLFRVYLEEMGFGHSAMEQTGYLLGIVPAMFRVLVRLPGDIEEMFSGEEES